MKLMMNKLILALMIVAGLTACGKSKEQIAVDHMSSALEAINEGDMLRACLKLMKAQIMFDQQVPNGKAKAQGLAPAVKKECHG
jgi:hypothetical protein